MFTLNPNSGIPIYRQVVEQIRRMISSSQLKPGAALPSVREVALTHAVNPMTISKAYSLLEAEGLLERQRGKAMTVASGASVRESKTERLQRLAPAIEQLVIAATQLELGIDDVLKTVRSQMERQQHQHGDKQ
jgi:GntR family transcriptional regulator